MAPPSPGELRALDEQLASTLALLRQFSASLTPAAADTPDPASPAEPTTASAPSPFDLLRDAATLLRAHTTKIGLLAISPPFTPSAVGRVVRELAGTCLPALMSAVQICGRARARWGGVAAREVRARVRRVFAEMEMLLEEVRALARGAGGGGGNAAAAGARRDSLSSTGVVWEACDALVELAALGVAGLAVQKAGQYRDTIQDAVAELREWREGEDPDTEGHDELLDDEDEGVEGDRDSVEDIFNAAHSMPKDRPELQALVEEADGKLKKIVLLYNAVIKRRFKTFDGRGGSDARSHANVAALDVAMESMRKVPHQVDELASCFYDLDEARAKEMLATCVREAKKATEAVRLSWEQKEDAFSGWSDKWQEVMG